jgi:hypothetical protein
MLAVSETEQPQNESTPLSRLDVGVLIVLVGMAIAAVIGLIAVVAADTEIGAFGTGFGLMFLVVQAGGTIACALACLTRRRAELGALGALVAAAIAVDLAVIGVWLGIDLEAYVKLAGVAFVWMFFGLILLGLVLAVVPRDTLARTLFRAAVVAGLLGGAIATVLVVTAGGDDIEVAAYPVPFGVLGDESLLRPLGASLVVLAALWLAALAASRSERTASS